MSCKLIIFNYLKYFDVLNHLKGGMYVFESISSITTAQSFLVIGFLESGVYMYVYRYNNVFLDIKMMVRKRPLEPY